MIKRGDRILIFNQAWGPLLRDFCDAVTDCGARCELVVGRDWSQKGSLGAGVVIREAPSLNRRSFRTRFLSWLSYSLASVRVLLSCSSSTRIVLFSNPPVLPFFVWLCSLVRRYQYSVMIYDAYPEILVGMGIIKEKSLVARTWWCLNKHAYERAFAVLTVGDGMAATVSKHFDPRRGKTGKILISRPWVDTSVVVPRPAGSNAYAALNPTLTTVLYSGNMGASHDMTTILRAIERLPSGSPLEFLFIGSGAAFEHLVAKSAGASKVRVLPWQPEENVPFIWAAAGIALISLRPGVEQCSFPSKTAFALSAGCAVVALTERPGDVADLIDRQGCGLVVKPGDSEDLARQLVALATDRALLGRCRKRARETAEELFDKKSNIEVMLRGIPA